MPCGKALLNWYWQQGSPELPTPGPLNNSAAYMAPHLHLDHDGLSAVLHSSSTIRRLVKNSRQVVCFETCALFDLMVDGQRQCRLNLLLLILEVRKQLYLT
jgi:hypothetical protein